LLKPKKHYIRHMPARHPRIVLVHGSVMGGKPTWSGQRALADRFELEVVERPGFAPNPPVDHVDFEEHARLVAGLVRPGDHLVGHSYGGVICLLAAAAVPERIHSLTVIEPPALDVARGDSAVEEFVRAGTEWWRTGPRDDPEAFLRGFLGFVGSDFLPPHPLPPALEQGARTLIVERSPWEARIDLDGLAAAGFPVLVVSGGHHPAFDAVCDVLTERLGAERLVLPGYAHTAQRHPDFNDALAGFVQEAEPRETG
jgi:pimeloyl-ACP methyl ester carboxylesterase